MNKLIHKAANEVIELLVQIGKELDLTTSSVTIVSGTVQAALNDGSTAHLDRCASAASSLRDHLSRARSLQHVTRDWVEAIKEATEE